MAQQRIYIHVPSSRTFLVTCNGQTAINWRELEQEARQSIEPTLRKRWQEYRQRIAMSTEQAQAPDATLDEVMQYVCSPEMEYVCPPELAAKAKF